MKKQLPLRSQHIGAYLAELKDLLIQHYGTKLSYTILYGSYSRGDFKPDSDIDILVVLNGEVQESKEIDALSELKNDLLLKHEIYISTNPVPVEKFEHSPFLFFKNVREQGILI